MWCSPNSKLARHSPTRSRPLDQPQDQHCQRSANRRLEDAPQQRITEGRPPASQRQATDQSTDDPGHQMHHQTTRQPSGDHAHKQEQQNVHGLGGAGSRKEERANPTSGSGSRRLGGGPVLTSPVQQSHQGPDAASAASLEIGGIKVLGHRLEVGFQGTALTEVGAGELALSQEEKGFAAIQVSP